MTTRLPLHMTGCSSTHFTFTLAASSFGTNTGRKITATTSGSGDGSKTVTIVGTDVNGDALTEVITLPGSADYNCWNYSIF